MKKTVFITLALLLSCVALQAQNAFFPAKSGMKMLYVNQNAKGKAKNYTRHTIKNVEGSGLNLTISYVMEILDKNMKPQSNPSSEIPCKVVIKDGVVILDMHQMFTDQMTSPDVKVEITGVPMELPSSLKPGQSLKDANIILTIDAGIMKMKTDVKITDGKCETIEVITVRAGTFTCHKITQTVTTTIMGREIVTTSNSWYAPNIGTVKTESFNNKNKLTGTTELISIEN